MSLTKLMLMAELRVFLNKPGIEEISLEATVVIQENDNNLNFTYVDKGGEKNMNE